MNSAAGNDKSAGEEPKLDRASLIDRLHGEIDNGARRNILLAGPWGSGKTTLLRDLENELARNAAETGQTKGDNSGRCLNLEQAFHVIWFSPWSTFADGDPLRAFIRVLHLEIEKSKLQVGPCSQAKHKATLRRVRRLGGLLKDLLKSSPFQDAATRYVPGLTMFIPALNGTVKLAEILMTNARDVGDEKAAPVPESPIDQMRAGAKKMFEDIAALNECERILLLVDDLDRARPEEALRTLDSLYHLFLPHSDDQPQKGSEWPVISVWAINTAVLQELLFREYRDLPSFDPIAYLEKIFTVRFNIPPLMSGLPVSSSINDMKGVEGAFKLWSHSLRKLQKEVQESIEELASRLAEEVNYSILSNLRLHGRIRRDCGRRWEKFKNEWYKRDYIRDARLIVLIDVFPSFRERIAPFNGMWPVFVNRLNQRERAPSSLHDAQLWHLESPDLITLLTDLCVLEYDEKAGCYNYSAEHRKRLQDDLIELWKDGF